MKSLLVTYLAICSGCVSSPGEPLDEPTLDRRLFVESVEPVLERRCASPNCHGNDRRRLRVYAPGTHRRAASLVHRSLPLDDDELDANLRSASAFAVGTMRASESLLYAKALGRVAHLGGNPLGDEAEPEARAILAWLRTGGLP